MPIRQIETRLKHDYELFTVRDNLDLKWRIIMNVDGEIKNIKKKIDKLNIFRHSLICCSADFRRFSVLNFEKINFCYAAQKVI